MADVHRFGHVGRTEIDDRCPGLRGLIEEQVFSARGSLQGVGQRCRLEPEIKEAGAGNLHLFAIIIDLQLGNHVGRHLTRVELSGLRQRHQGVALIIAKLRVRARAHQHGRNVSVRQGSHYRLSEALFDELMGEHGLARLPELHG